MKSFYQELESGLVFLPELGIGRYPVPASRPYDEQYFAKYQQLADTETGRALTQSRIELVERHFHGPVLDVGIGAVSSSLPDRERLGMTLIRLVSPG
jgi:hypothetical protein